MSSTGWDAAGSPDRLLASQQFAIATAFGMHRDDEVERTRRADSSWSRSGRFPFQHG